MSQENNDELTIPDNEIAAAPSGEITAPPDAATLSTPPVLAPLTVDEPDPEAEMHRLSRRSFLWAGAVVFGSAAGLKWFNDKAPTDNTGVKQVFRNTLQFNEAVAQRIFFAPTHLAHEFPRSKAVKPRNNYHGSTPEIDLAAWKLHLSGSVDGDRILTLADLQAIPTAEQTTELKCVEGWSAIVNWSGFSLAEFIKKFPPAPGTAYIQMRSEPEGYEDDWYYVGLDMPACLHPQSLLATHMNGQPLTAEHGAPLRLVMPHKYGIKQIKLITHIAYTKQRPDDYWAEQGYDWYAGL